jgi:hypothetical protein
MKNDAGIDGFDENSELLEISGGPALSVASDWSRRESGRDIHCLGIHSDDSGTKDTNTSSKTEIAQIIREAPHET